MIQTAEQLIENVRALPLSEKEKFFSLAEAEKLKILSEREAKDLELKEKNKKFQLALQWIEEHKEEYDGQFVLLDGDKLLAHGTDAKALYAEARAGGIKTPLVHRVKAEILPFGGW
jgi:hypothetical protein